MGAIAGAAEDDAASQRSQQFNQDFLRSQQTQQQGREADQAQQLRYAQLGQQGREAEQTNQYRYDEMGQRQAELAQKNAETTATKYTDPDTGKTYDFTPEQLAWYQNIKTTTGGEGPEFDAAMYQFTTGKPKPEEEQEYTLTAPDGTQYTASMKPKELIAAVGQGWKYDQAQQGLDIKAQAQQDKWDLGQRALDLRQQTVDDLRQYRGGVLQQNVEKMANNLDIAEQRIQAEAARRATSESQKLELQAMTKEEKNAANAVVDAQNELTNLKNQQLLPPVVDDPRNANDPWVKKVKATEETLRQATANREAMLRDDAARLLSVAPFAEEQVPGTQPSAAGADNGPSTNPANSGTRGAGGAPATGVSTTPPAYTQTMVNPTTGQRIGKNPTTGKWDVIP